MKHRMLRWLGAAALAVSAACGAHAAPKAAAPAPAPASAYVAPVPLLWKVTGTAGSEVYLLGSIHMLTSADYPLSADVDAAFKAANRLVFELGPEDVSSPALPMQMMQAALRSDGRQLKDDLDAATWAKLSDYAARNKMPLERLQGLKPWFVALTISIAQMTKLGMDPELGLDRHLMQLGQKSGKPMSGLETGLSQIKALDGMDAVEQRQLLAEALEHDASGGLERQMHAAWRAGDAATLWEQMGVPMRKDYPQLYQRINVARNTAWLPLLQPHLKANAGRTLVVVGALHLLGPDGVVEQLRGRGYAVERICSACAPEKKSRR